MTKVVQLAKENAESTLNQVYTKYYGLKCTEDTLSIIRYRENILYQDLIKSGIICTKNTSKESGVVIQTYIK